MRHLLARRPLALLLCAAALLLKLAMPAGYMIGSGHGRVTVRICSGGAPATMTMAIPGVHDDVGHDAPAGQDRPDAPCAFAGLSAAALGAVDPVQLAALLVFILTAGVRSPPAPTPSRPEHLRPPLRGPPADR